MSVGMVVNSVTSLAVSLGGSGESTQGATAFEEKNPLVATSFPEQAIAADALSVKFAVVESASNAAEVQVRGELLNWKSNADLSSFITSLGYPKVDNTDRSFDSVLVRYINSSEYDPKFVAENGAKVTALSAFLFQMSAPLRGLLAQDSTLATPEVANRAEAKPLTMIAWPVVDRVCHSNGITFPPPLPAGLYQALSLVLPVDPNSLENDFRRGLDGLNK